jgi:SAM-dependent methyltransferase
MLKDKLFSATKSLSRFTAQTFACTALIFFSVWGGMELWFAYSEKGAPYVTTDRAVVYEMLEAVDVSSEDVVYDLGSGDGRIPIAAAKKYGARGVGVEIDSSLVVRSRARAEEVGVASQVEFRRQDLFNTDLSDATVVTLYLFRDMNIRLRPKLLRQLDPGDRIVSHDFGMGRWEPDRVIDGGPDKTGRATLYVWTVPKKIPQRLLQIPEDLQE